MLGTTFGASSSDRMSLNTSRIGESVRQNAFSLHSRTISDINDSAGMASNRFISAYPKPVLRKSFRKTLRTVEGVRVRMKNCFVPYVPVPSKPSLPSAEAEDDSERDDLDAAAEEEEAAAGSEERTVILSVEIENSSDSALGFIVENVSLTISGGLAHATLIGWGEDGIDSNVFPLRLRGIDQYNLLYRVSFLMLPEGNPANDRHDTVQKRQSMMSARSLQSTAEAMRRYVAIDLVGHPFRPAASAASGTQNQGDGEDVGRESPTSMAKNPPPDDVHLESYSSRWNCLLDLLTTQQADPPTFYNRPASPLSVHDVMPTPPSPFPRSTSKNAVAQAQALISPPTPTAPWNLPKSGSEVRTSTPTFSASSTLSPPPLSAQSKFTPSSPSAVMAAINAQAQAQAQAQSQAQILTIGGSPTPRTDRFPSTIFSDPRSSMLGAPPGATAFISEPQIQQIPPTPAFPSCEWDSSLHISALHHSG